MSRVSLLNLTLATILLTIGGLAVWTSLRAFQLWSARSAPAGAYLVCGGSIAREVYAAEVALRSPDVPILISGGSAEPCVWLIFQRMKAPKGRVFLEKTARSSFENFAYALPILQEWAIRKVVVISSGTHQARAIAMSRIMLGSHGIWTELEAAPETGRPANKESEEKAMIDRMRAICWAVASQFYLPRTSHLVKLDEVDIEEWMERGFHCEHQAGLNEPAVRRRIIDSRQKHGS